MGKLMIEIKYGIWEGSAVRFNSETGEAWLCGDDNIWRQINGADAVTKAAILSAAEFFKTFGQLPLMPKAAFQENLTR